MTLYKNLFIDQGSDFEVEVQLQNSTSEPRDLTNLEFYGQARKSAGSSTAYNFTVSSVTNKPGTIKIAMSNKESGYMKPGRYVYDIYARNQSTNKEFKLVEGIVEIIHQVTNIQQC